MNKKKHNRKKLIKLLNELKTSLYHDQSAQLTKKRCFERSLSISGLLKSIDKISKISQLINKN